MVSRKWSGIVGFPRRLFLQEGRLHSLGLFWVFVPWLESWSWCSTWLILMLRLQVFSWQGEVYHVVKFVGFIRITSDISSSLLDDCSDSLLLQPDNGASWTTGESEMCCLSLKVVDGTSSSTTCSVWRFPEIGLPPVLIHFCDFPLQTIFGYPHDYGPPPKCNNPGDPTNLSHVQRHQLPTWRGMTMETPIW